MSKTFHNPQPLPMQLSPLARFDEGGVSDKVLARIFHYVANLFREEYGPDTNERVLLSVERTPQVVLLQVCGRWRRVGLGGCPDLWCDVYTISNIWTDRSLHLSRDLPLSVFIIYCEETCNYMCPDYKTVASVVSQMHRIRELALIYDGVVAEAEKFQRVQFLRTLRLLHDAGPRAGSLEYLRIFNSSSNRDSLLVQNNNYHIFPVHLTTPNLSVLHLVEMHANLYHFSATRSLTKLTIEDCTLADSYAFLQVLAQCPVLEELEIRNSFDKIIPQFSIPNTSVQMSVSTLGVRGVHLHRITRLVLANNIYTLYTVFPFLCIPRTAYVELRSTTCNPPLPSPGARILIASFARAVNNFCYGNACAGVAGVDDSGLFCDVDLGPQCEDNYKQTLARELYVGIGDDGPPNIQIFIALEPREVPGVDFLPLRIFIHNAPDICRNATTLFYSLQRNPAERMFERECLMPALDTPVDGTMLRTDLSLFEGIKRLSIPMTSADHFLGTIRDVLREGSFPFLTSLEELQFENWCFSPALDTLTSFTHHVAPFVHRLASKHALKSLTFQDCLCTLQQIEVIRSHLAQIAGFEFEFKGLIETEDCSLHPRSIGYRLDALD